MENKSVKLQWIEGYVCMTRLYKETGMQAKVWRHYETGVYFYVCGYPDDMPSFRASCDTLDELHEEMGDLRHWVVNKGM